MIKCNGCHKEFSTNEIDLDGFCYECSNYDPAPAVTIDQAIALAVKGVIEGIDVRAGSKIKVDNGEAS